jgi:arylsulfatase
MSDNGPEGANPLDWAEYYNEWALNSFDLSLENLGRPLSYAWTGPSWAQVSSAPFRMFKGFTYDGGTRVPTLLSWPEGINREQPIVDTFMHVLDLPKTFLSLAGIEHPGTESQGFANRKLEGKLLTPVFADNSASVYTDDDYVIWEMLDRRAVRKGNWKLVWTNKPWGKGIGQWELYNLELDPAEQLDVSDEYPLLVSELEAAWHDYVARNQLVLLPDGVDMRWTNIVTHFDYTPMPKKYLEEDLSKESTND